MGEDQRDPAKGRTSFYSILKKSIFVGFFASVFILFLSFRLHNIPEDSASCSVLQTDANISAKLKFLENHKSWKTNEKTNSFLDVFPFKNCEFLAVKTGESFEIWKTRSQKLAKSLKPCRIFRFSLSEEFFLCVNERNKVLKIASSDFSVKDLTTHRGDIVEVLISKDERYAAFVAFDSGRFEVLVKETELLGRRKRVLGDVKGKIEKIEFIGRHLVYLDRDGFKVYDVEKRLVVGLAGNEEEVDRLVRT